MSCSAPNCAVECPLCIAARVREHRDLIARADRAEAACAAWMEAHEQCEAERPAMLAALNIPDRPSIGVRKARELAASPSPGSDLLERLRRAEEVNEIQTAHLSAIQSAAGNPGNLLYEVGRLRAENERLRAAVSELPSYPCCEAVRRIESKAGDATTLLGGWCQVHGNTVFRAAFCGSHGERFPCYECRAAEEVLYIGPEPRRVPLWPILVWLLIPAALAAWGLLR